jgi:hypothetical protein
MESISKDHGDHLPHGFVLAHKVSFQNQDNAHVWDQVEYYPMGTKVDAKQVAQYSQETEVNTNFRWESLGNIRPELSEAQE